MQRGNNQPTLELAKMANNFATSDFHKTEEDSQAKIGYLKRTKKYSDLKNLRVLGDNRKRNNGDSDKHMNTESFHFHKLFMVKSEA